MRTSSTWSTLCNLQWSIHHARMIFRKKTFPLFAQGEIEFNANQSFFARVKSPLRWSRRNIFELFSDFRLKLIIEIMPGIFFHVLNKLGVSKKRLRQQITPTRSNFRIFLILFLSSLKWEINSHKNLWLLHATTRRSLLPFNFRFLLMRCWKRKKKLNFPSLFS